MFAPNSFNFCSRFVFNIIYLILFIESVISNINNSNAYYANVIRNDVLIEINGIPIGSAVDYYYYMRNYYGTTFNLKVIRNGREINITY